MICTKPVYYELQVMMILQKIVWVRGDDDTVKNGE